MKKIFSIITFISLTYFCHGQTFPWAKSAIGSGPEEGTSVATDVSGNVYITGSFVGSTISFGTYTLNSISNSCDIYLTKYDANGNVIWAKNFGGAGTDQAYSVTTDLSGNVLVTGNYFSPNITLGTYTFTNSGGRDVILFKCDSNGNILWAKTASGTISGLETVYSVTTDQSNNVFITGGFTSTSLIFGTYTLTNPPASWNLFIVKYDSNGNEVWAKGAGGGGTGYGDVGLSVSCDLTGSAFITGHFASATISFGTYTLSNAGTSSTLDVFVTKYDVNGNVLWAKSAGGTGNDEGNTVLCIAGGDIIITGDFNSTAISFGTYTITNSGGSDGFLTKFDSNGNVIWAKDVGAANNDVGYSVSTFSNALYVTGSYTLSTTIGTNTFSPGCGSCDPMFIARYDLSGNLICVSSLNSGGDDINSVCVDQSGNVYFTGDFMSNNFVVGTTTLTQTGIETAFVAKYICSDVGINEFSVDSFIKVYPNPNNGSFKLQIDNEIENGEIILINLLGQTVHRQKISQGENNIITTDLAKGLHNYIILRDKGQISNGKLTVE